MALPLEISQQERLAMLPRSLGCHQCRCDCECLCGLSYSTVRYIFHLGGPHVASRSVLYLCGHICRGYDNCRESWLPSSRGSIDLPYVLEGRLYSHITIPLLFVVANTRYDISPFLYLQALWDYTI